MVDVEHVRSHRGGVDQYDIHTGLGQFPIDPLAQSTMMVVIQHQGLARPYLCQCFELLHPAIDAEGADIGTEAAQDLDAGPIGGIIDQAAEMDAVLFRQM